MKEFYKHWKWDQYQNQVEPEDRQHLTSSTAQTVRFSAMTENAEHELKLWDEFLHGLGGKHA